jgi:hypothetical protein
MCDICKILYCLVKENDVEMGVRYNIVRYGKSVVAKGY